MNRYYVLIGEEVVPCASVDEWLQKCSGQRNERVDRTVISNNVFVSTVFLGLDHNFGVGEPLVFETMIFGDHPDAEIPYRTATLAEAKAKHTATVARMQDDLDRFEL